VADRASGSDPRPRPRTEAETGFERKDMVAWLSPRFLVSAAFEVLVSGTFSRLLDKRELAAGLPQYGDDLRPAEGEPPAPPFPDASYRDEDGALWLDYTADVGEGFDPTYTVAWLIAREKIELEHGGERHLTKRGRALVLGGDQVYPSASWEAYRDRFVGPYQAALPHLAEDQIPNLFAIPGNHDWYDGLTSFTRLFTQRGWIGAWRTRQRRSYFALRLSERWWLWGTDVQFDTYLDGPQLEYFRRASEDLKAGHQVILVTAKPSWHAAKRERGPALKKEGAWQTLSFVEEELIGGSEGKLALTLSGDHHHYARYERTAGEGPAHRITAGGGGAHTMGTASLKDTLRLPSLRDAETTATYELRSTSPTPAESDEMRDSGFARAVRGALELREFIAVLYLVVALIVAAAIKDSAPDFSGHSFPEVIPDAISPWSLLLLGALGFALFKFANVKSDPALKRRVAARHWLEHTILAVAPPIAMIALLSDTGLAQEGAALGFISALVSVAMGFIAGPWVFARYILRVNRTGASRHSGEIWGALGSSEFKSFLRLKIDRDELLTIYPIGVRNSVEWRFEPDGDVGDPWFAPVGEEPAPTLIESPIILD
jgi:hypothetical protein